MTYAAAGDYTNAITVVQRALDVAKRKTMPDLVNRLQNAQQAYQAGRIPQSDWKNDPKILLP
jgi:hypothetical protein